MLQISQLFIYPIKSLGGIELTEARVTDRGFEHDRRWMLVDMQNMFLTQRELPNMAFFKPDITAEGLKVTFIKDHSSILIPFEPLKIEPADVVIWDDTCPGLFVDDLIDAWFSKRLGYQCRLVFMPDDSHRLVEEKYNRNDSVTSFSDAYPYLIIGQASMDNLNSLLEENLPINRFRPNIVFTGGEPHQEDLMAHFVINGISFFGVKPCARCPIPTIDQATATFGKEPLKTLAQYRRQNNKVLFGQNLLHEGEGIVRVGDVIEVKEVKEAAISAV